ncbi:MAG: type II toxin-antitoxin system HicA family toxin [Bacteroidales bacterium]|nr:type II toxin-antitoxin system HicA family toxin [Bacteroidales bacterium]
MKYSELERILKKAGCYSVSGGRHPVWFSPLTNKFFRMSNHVSEEVKKGTLNAIKRDAGI